METFFVFKVSMYTFAADYEGKYYRKGNRNVLKSWI